MAFKDDFVSLMRASSTAPFLFIGSGISRRYINLETWESLLRKFSEHTEHPFNYYSSSADSDLPKTASELASVFYDTWWNKKNKNFAESRKQHSEEIRSRESPLKLEISKYVKLKSVELTEDEALLQEIEFLKNSVIDGIITTNWDTLLESLFPEFKVYIGQEKLLFSSLMGVDEIYKIHGCVTEHDSLVLTQNDYSDFHKKNAYLTSKLLTIFVENPVIFLGYSLQDENVRLILGNIIDCLSSENLARLQKRLIFVKWDRDSIEPKIVETALTFGQGKSIPLTQILTNSFSPIFESLSHLQRKFPLGRLRKLKEHIFTLVKTRDPSNKIFVKDIDADITSDFDVVLGVGIDVKTTVSRLGYAGVGRDELVRDIIFDDTMLDAIAICKEVLPKICRINTNVPIFKYLKKAGFLNNDGSIKIDMLDEKLAHLTSISAARFAKYPISKPEKELVKSAKTISEIMTSEIVKGDLKRAVHIIPYLKKIKVAELRNFLSENFIQLTNLGDNEKTYFVKLVCFLDFIENKN